MKNSRALLVTLPKITGALFVLIGLQGCAHHRDVRPGADGVHRVLVRAPDKSDSDRSAISQAEHYCEQTQKHPAFVNEKSQYTGSMDEKTRSTVKQASTAARILGGQGSPLGGAGTIGGVMTGGDDYQTEMSFKCQ